MKHVSLKLTAAIFASVTALALATVATLTGETKAAHAERCAKNLTIRVVASIDDVVTYFREQQAIYLLLTPPTPNLVRRQSCGVIPFDSKGFPPEMLKGLIEEMDKHCPVYRLVVAEDARTRETVFANAMGYEIHAIAAAKNYDPWWLLLRLHPALYSGAYMPAHIELLKQCYDPANIQIVLTLLPVEYIDAYAAEIASPYNVAPSGGGTPLMRYAGPPVTNIQLAIAPQTNGMRVTVVYPDDFTNRIDVFACTKLVDAWWDLAVTTNVSTSTNWVSWLDPAMRAWRFYAAGNADVDTDADGLADARETFLYHTLATTNDTDGDLLGDHEEVINRRTDPNDSDTTLPTVSILLPSNGSGKVWLP